MKSGGKILLVDDDPILRSEFKDCFEEFDVSEAGNGGEALKILKKPNEIDLVVLDVRMPGMNGLEVLTEIRKISADIGIIIFTGYGSKDIVVQALREKADDFIEKPLDVDNTRKIIEGVLEKKKHPDSAEAGDLKSKVERVKRYIERNYLKKISLNDAAKVVCLSSKYLSRVFSEYAGEGFNDYKLKLKINKAKKMLKEGGSNINDIAYKIGYENTESFIRQFKKITKRTPSEYRNKNK